VCFVKVKVVVNVGVVSLSAPTPLKFLLRWLKTRYELLRLGLIKQNPSAHTSFYCCLILLERKTDDSVFVD